MLSFEAACHVSMDLTQISDCLLSFHGLTVISPACLLQSPEKTPYRTASYYPPQLPVSSDPGLPLSSDPQQGFPL